MTLSKTTFFTALLVTLLTFSLAQAQDSDQSSPLQEGSRALQFQVSENLNLSSFSGTLFSYKRHLSDTRANRIGVSLNSQYRINDFSESDNHRENTTALFNLGIEYSRMHYTNPDSEIKFYYGYGPGINLGFNRYVQDDSDTKRINQRAIYGISAIGYTGVEWFFHSSMSLHAEYRGSVGIDHMREKRTTETDFSEETDRTDNNTSFRLGGDGVRFGISVFF